MADAEAVADRGQRLCLVAEGNAHFGAWHCRPVEKRVRLHLFVRARLKRLHSLKRIPQLLRRVPAVVEFGREEMGARIFEQAIQLVITRAEHRPAKRLRNRLWKDPLCVTIGIEL